MSGNLNPSDSGQKHKFGFRLFIGGIALFIGAKTWDLFAEKYGGETPDWLLIVFLVIAGLAGVYWLCTSDPVVKRYHLIRDYPQMSLFSMVLIGAVIGATIGFLFWWSIFKQKTSPVASNTTSEKPAVAGSDNNRLEFLAESSKALRDVSFRIKLNRKYTPKEIGHFRVLFGVADHEKSLFWFAGQDAYRTLNDKLPDVKQFGIRYTAFYEVKDKKKKYKLKTIPIYDDSPLKHTTVINGLSLIDNIEVGISLYEQVPSCKLLDDIDKTKIHFYVTENLADLIDEIIIEANSYKLTSKKRNQIKWGTEQPSIKWFQPLSNTDNAQKWVTLGVIDPTGQLDKMLGIHASYAWQLDFSLSTPEKIVRESLGNN